MINKTCKSCSQPMNGGVYRKPNLCPHCHTIQDENRAPDNKLLNPQAKIEAPAQVLSPSVFFDEVRPVAAAAYAVQEIDIEEATQELDVLSEIHAIAQVQPIEENIEASVEIKEETAEVEVVAEAEEPEENTAQNIVAEEEKAVDPELAAPESEEPIHFDNLETKPNENESLDIALDLGGVSNDVLIVTREVVARDTAAATEALVQLQEEAAQENAQEPNPAEEEREPVLLDETVVEKVDSEEKVVEKEVDVEEAVPEKEELMVFIDEVDVESEPKAAEVITEELTMVDGVSDESTVCVAEKAVGVGVQEKHSEEKDGTEYETIVLTTESATNMMIEKRIDMVSAECVFGTDMVKSRFAPMTEVARPEHSASPNVLKDARKTVLDEIKKEAFLLGANTVVEVKLDYSEISRGAAPMMMVVATGTAVKAQAA